MAADDKVEVEAFESTAFEALEKDFQEVLQELIGDKSLEHFRLEYEKLHRALKKSHESEKRLIKKCRELNGEIVSNAVKVQTALNLSKEDQSTIQNLKKEIERAWKMVEASHDKEQRAKETIHNLKVEIANLSHLVEQGAGLSVNQENTVNSLVSQRDELVKTRERLESQVQKMTQDNINLTELEHRHESEKLQGEVEIANVKDMLNAKRTEAEREMRRRERLEKELSELRSALAVKNKQLEGYVKEIKNQEDQQRADGLALREKKELVVKAKDREADVVAQIELERSALRQKEVEKTGMHDANIDIQKQIKERQEEIKLGTQDNDKSQKNYEGLKRRKLLDDDERRELEVNRAVLKSDVENLIREIEQLRKQVDGDVKKVEEIMRERETLTRSVMRAEDRTKTQSDVVKDHQNKAQGLEKDVGRVKLDLQDAIKTVYGKDKEREKFGIEVSMANTKFMASLEELKNRDNKTSELKKNLSDVRSKLAQQKNQYEAVRTDRNLYSKNLVESQDEIAEMKRKFKIMHHQIEQLKEEIKEKDQALQQEQNHHRKVEKTNDQLKDQMERAKKRQDQLQKQKETSQAEIKKLVDSIKDAEEQRNQQKKTYEEKISERDILGTQLIRRNDELALLYEKIKIQQRTLQEGEVAYKQRLEESRALQIMAAGLKREKAIAYQQVASIDDLKKEIFSLQRELLRERTKVKALSEELENPMNVHRWRKLEGQDPATFEMIQKVKTLQKRLISKTEEAVEKDLAIQEKEKLYLEMRNLLAKQPGPEIVEEASQRQQSLKERTRQMKAMAAELNMYHAQLNDYKDEIERLTKELQDTKRKYFEQRRREQLVRDASRSTDRPPGGGAQTGSGGLQLQLV